MRVGVEVEYGFRGGCGRVDNCDGPFQHKHDNLLALDGEYPENVSLQGDLCMI